jgi:uncharacterized membrane protein
MGKQAFISEIVMAGEEGALVRVAGGDMSTSVATAITPSAGRSEQDPYIVIGYGETPEGNRAFRAEIIRDSSGALVVELLENLSTLSGGSFSKAYAVSPDGAFVVGVSDSPRGSQACYWYYDETLLDWVAVGIGALSNRTFDSIATGVAVDDEGSLRAIVGYSAVEKGSMAFLWSPGGGMVSLSSLLMGFDLEVGAWTLFEATGISDDGMVICGTGINLQHNVEAWVAENVMEIDCEDGADNDGDGLADCDDPDAPPPAQQTIREESA